MEAEGGYDLEVVPFVKEPPDLLMCPVCISVLRDPVLMECCGKNFCETCIGMIRHANKPCPWCQNYPIGNMIKDKRTMREVQELQVYCKQRDKGCEWTGELRYIKDHEAKCDYTELECKFGCKERFIRREWEKHMEVCTKSPVDIQLKVLKRTMETRLAALEEKNQRADEEMKLVPALQEQVAGLGKEKDLLQTKMISQAADLKEALQAQQIYKEQVDGLQQDVKVLRGQLDQQSENIRATMMPKIHDAIILEVRELLVAEQDAIHSAVNKKLQGLVKKEMEGVHHVVNELVDRELEVGIKREMVKIHQSVNNEIGRQMEGVQHKVNDTISKQVDREVEESITREMESFRRSASDEIHTTIGREMTQARSEIVLPSSVPQPAASLPSSPQASYTEESARLEYQDQVDLTALQVGLLRQDHSHKASSTEKRLRALFNEVAINRQAIAATLDKDLKVVADWQPTVEVCSELPLWQAAAETSTPFPLPPFEFTMPNYSKLKHNRSPWFSPAFYHAYSGYKMQLRIDAYGAGDGKGTHLSLYVCLVQGQYDDQLAWPCRGEMYVQLINWRENAQHVRELVGFSGGKIVSEVAAKSRPKGKGRHQFVVHQVLESQREEDAMLLRNDCLRIQVERVFVPDFFAVSMAVKAPSWESNCVVPCEFTMTKFDSYRETEQSWYSSPFYSHYGGYKLCIRLDANGDGRGKGTHISLYVSLMKGEYDDRLSWPFKGEVKIVMLNWLEDKNHIEEKISFNKTAGEKVCGRVTQGSRALIGRGRNQFLPQVDLTRNEARNIEYCRNGCLRMRVKKVTVTP